MEFEPRTTIKAQALVNLLQEITHCRSAKPEVWEAYVNGYVTKEGVGAGIFIYAPSDQEAEIWGEVQFPNSNNEAEALVRDLWILVELEVVDVIVYSEPASVAHLLMKKRRNDDLF